MTSYKPPYQEEFNSGWEIVINFSPLNFQDEAGYLFSVQIIIYILLIYSLIFLYFVEP